MSLLKVLNRNYPNSWSSFPSPTDTIDDYENIVWNVDNPPSKSELGTKIEELELAEPMRLLRIERDRLLATTDWVSARSVDSGTPVSQEWVAYRQALRDLPATAEPKLENGQITNVTWPVQPE